MNQIKWIGTLVFAILGIASLLLYRERVLYLDSAYYAFRMINKELPTAEHNRHALYLYQLIPWIMLKLKMSIPLVLMAFSVCHILFHALVFYLLIKIKQHKLAGILLLMQIISYRECFFLTVNETALAISASLMLAGLLNYFQTHKANPAVEGSMYFLCILTALFSHPMSMILLPYIIGYHILSNANTSLKKQSSAIVITEFLMVLLLKKIGSSGSGYEDDLFAQLNHTGRILADLGNVYSFNFFFGHFKLDSYFFRIYFIPLFLSLFCIIRLFRDQQYRILTFYLISSIGFWLLIIVFFNRGDGNIFMEKNFTPWVMVTLYPLVHLTGFRENSLHTVTLFLFTAILIFSLRGIYKVSPMYKKRLYLMDQLITVKNISKSSKLIVQDSTINHDEWLGIWALPYETLLLSKVKNIPNRTAKIYHNEKTINNELWRSDIFLGADFIPVLQATYLLNQKYFNLEAMPYVSIQP